MVPSRRSATPLRPTVRAIVLAVAATAAPSAASPTAERSPALPALALDVRFYLRGTPAATRTIADVDVLVDGRVAILDFDARRVAVFQRDGRFLKFLEPPSGISPGQTITPRLAALPGGGLVVVDDEGKRFFFYDGRLEPSAVVSHGIDLSGVNGFVRHPSGDLYLVGYARDKVLHRFDSNGEYMASYVDPVDLGFPERGIHNTGFIAVDPKDATLWVSRMTPYEILHVTPDGELLGSIARGGLPGFTPWPAERLGAKTYRYRPGFSSSAKIAVVDGLVVNSYVLDNGKKLADVFDRDGNLVEAELTIDSPLAFVKRAADGSFVRHFNGDSPRVEVWRGRGGGGRCRRAWVGAARHFTQTGDPRAPGLPFSGAFPAVVPWYASC